MKSYNIIEDVLIAVGIGVSLVDIQQILSIIILCFNVIWIMVKVVLKIVEHYKAKNYNAIADDVKQSIDELEDLKNKVDSKNKDDGK